MESAKSRFKGFLLYGLLGVFSFILTSSSQLHEAIKSDEGNGDKLFQIFKNPPSEARPFVRWWWNGNRVNEQEVLRELDLLRDAGFGGVEINPIAMPPVTREPGQKALKWLSPEWNQVLKAACQGAKERGLIADLLVGSGWPFGGKFLRPDQTIERMAVNYKDITGPQDVRFKIQDLEDDLPAEYLGDKREKESERTISFIRLFPQDIGSTDQISDLTSGIDNGEILISVPEGKHRLAWGVLQKGYREVVHGTFGAEGPTMDHLDKEVVEAFLNRLLEIEKELGITLDQLIRALFADSMELAGSNWCKDFADEFQQRCGYSLDPFLPFIFYYYNEPYPFDIPDKKFKDEIQRARFDYTRILVDLFHERFTTTFQEFCRDHGLKCRYQAYGSPWLIGMLEGYMKVDIPESNNWFYSRSTKPDVEDYFTWSKIHGYMIWNKYASSGGHLTGKNIISCEAMTNLGGVFQASLSTIKQAGDMNFISGITHSVLHGYNYSPPEAGFPGWIRYGTFFSEHNTLWPYFRKWLNYDARIASVLQNTNPQIDIAILGPEADKWSEHGLRREPLHTDPWYVYDLWEGISQNGSSCDYINQTIMQEASMKKGRINYGPMKYEILIIADNKSMSVATAKAIKKFVKTGGKLICIGQKPVRSTSLSEIDQDAEVSSLMDEIMKYDDQVFCVDAPDPGTSITTWIASLLKNANVDTDMKIKSPDRSLYQIHHKDGDNDIFFITNTNRRRTINLDAELEVEGTSAWRWNPENGTRELINWQNRTIDLTLSPLESTLIYIEQGKKEEIIKKSYHAAHEVKELVMGSGWTARFEPKVGEPFTKTFTGLEDFKESNDILLQNFAGTVVYSIDFEAEESNFNSLDLGEVNDGVTKVILNGMSLGVKWYGKHVYEIDSQMRLGPNTLVIEYTSLLSNYCRSLDKVEAKRWIRDRDLISNGITGPVVFK